MTNQDTTRSQLTRPLSWVMGLAVTGVGILLIAAFIEVPQSARGLTAVVKGKIPQSGVEHPVTAVLLNFRAYDTWLEVGVLLIAVMGMLLFQRRSDLRDIKKLPSPEPVLSWLIRLLFPMIVLVSGYLLWRGKYSSGGAFQAGVVLGAGAVLLWLAGHASITALSGRWFRFILLGGFFSFMLAGYINLAHHQALLYLPPEHAGTIILLLETAATLSIALTVSALIIGLQPLRPKQPDAVPLINPDERTG